MLQHVTLSLFHPDRALSIQTNMLQLNSSSKNHLHYKRECWGLRLLLFFLWIVSSVSLHFHFFHDWGNVTPRMSPILYRIFYKKVCAECTRSFKSPVLSSKNTFSKPKRATWRIKMFIFCSKSTFMSGGIMNWQDGDSNFSQVKLTSKWQWTNLTTLISLSIY